MDEVQAYWLPFCHGAVDFLPQANPEGRGTEGPGLEGPLSNKAVHAWQVSPLDGLMGLVHVGFVILIAESSCGWREILVC
jgi:hypothetical protein